MKRNFKIIAITLATVLINNSACFATAHDAQFNWASDYINTVVENGIMSNYEDGRFKPSKLVTRGDMARIIQKMENFNSKDISGKNSGLVATIEEPSENVTVPTAIEYCIAKGIMGLMSDGDFRQS